MPEPRERTLALQREIESQTVQQLAATGWGSIQALFVAFAREQRIEGRMRRAAAHADVALALLRYPPELGAALAARLPTLHPPMRYNPFGMTMLAMARLDSLRRLTAEQCRRAGEVLALTLLTYMPAPRWARAVYAATPFDERIRAELDHALRARDAQLAATIITATAPRPQAELAWLRHVNPAITLAFAARYLLSVLTPPFVNAGLGAVLGQVRTGDWTTGWFWGLTAGIAIAVAVQQLVYRPKLQRLVQTSE